MPVAFARVLRTLGVDVPVGSVVAYAQALEAAGVERRAQVYWAGRATLVVRPEDIAAYDAAFTTFYLASPMFSTAPAAVENMEVVAAAGGRYSPYEVLRHKDFAAYTDDEAAEARRLLAGIRLHTPPKPSRRAAPSRRGTPDVRRIVRHALRTHGEPFRRPAKGPTATPRRLVLLLDVSASMAPYARALVRFVHAAVSSRSNAKVDAFAIGTRVTRLTRELRSRDADAAIAAAVRRAPDWSGGTRLGDGLHEFNSRWPAHGAVVVILSDGWDHGDPDRLAEQLARTQRAAHRLIWVNPLKASAGYEPLARGMAAALPYVDDFVEGHSLAALQELARVIAK